MLQRHHALHQPDCRVPELVEPHDPQSSSNRVRQDMPHTRKLNVHLRQISLTPIASSDVRCNGLLVTARKMSHLC